MKTLIYTLVVSLLSLTNLTTPAEQLSKFMGDAVSQQLTNTELADEYFCTNMLHRTDEYGEKARKGLNWVLTMQRQELRKCRMNINKLTFTPFDELMASERPAKPFHMLSDTKNVYVARYHGKIVYYFLLQDAKIASTLLINQGGEHYFMDFCH